MGVRQRVHQDLESVFPFAGFAGSQQILHQFEYADDVASLPLIFPGRRQVLRQQEDDGGEEALRRVIEEGVLSVVGSVPLWIHDSLGEDLGVLFRLGPRRQIGFILAADIHVVVDERQEIVSVRPCWVTQVDDRYLIAIVFGGHSSIVPCEVAFGIQCQKAHPAGTGILQIGIQKVRRFTNARRADHQAVNIVGVHDGLHGIALFPFPLFLALIDLTQPGVQFSVLLHRPAPNTAQHQPLGCWQILTPAPFLRLERDMLVGRPNLLLGGPARGPVLAVTHGF